MPIERGKDAPLISAYGDKWNNQGARSKDNPNGLLFGQMPIILRRYINNSLNGLHGNHLKLMYLLIETKEKDFRASQKWVLEETGMPKDKYYKARKDLEDMGWIICEDDTIYINYGFLWEKAFNQK